MDPKADDKEDIFATLFSPPTPRASPSHTPEPGYSRQRQHARTESTDSDFGAFVSVPAAEDPLHPGSGPDLSPFSSIQNYGFFDKFTEDAKVASERKRREVLDELLQHENDPLYWLQGMGTTLHPSSSGTSTPQPAHHTSSGPLQPLSPGDSLIDLDSPSESKGGTAFVPPAPHPDPSSSVSEHPPTKPISISQTQDLLVNFDVLQDDLENARQPRQRPHTSTSAHHLVNATAAAHLRSPSLPPSTPARPSDPEIQRAQSSYFTPSTSFPSRWVSSLLSSTIRSPRAGASTPPASADSIFISSSPPQSDEVSAFSSRFGTFSRSAPHSRAPTLSESAPSLDAAITHGTPFGSQPFVAPSGAPGFAGDRQWDKGFEFDKSQVERKSVRLVGRKEMTVPVLTTELADMLRPFLPALARLPKSWTLLYSLDQHGISLNTLYARCQEFKGSALFVVRDAGEAVFGAWMGEGIHPSKGAYYGSGESFLWQMAAKDCVRVFKWTGKNDYVALCESDYLSFGGGDGHYGLWLDDTLMDGSSARCPTFGNEPLCSPGPRKGETITFECVALEVWGIG